MKLVYSSFFFIYVKIVWNIHYNTWLILKIVIHINILVYNHTTMRKHDLEKLKKARKIVKETRYKRFEVLAEY